VACVLALRESTVTLSSSTVELTAANSDLLAVVALREVVIDHASLTISARLSKTKSKRAISPAVAVVALREYKIPSNLSTAVLNEVIVEFRAVKFSSMLSSLSLSTSISAMTSSIVAGCASTVKTLDDTVAADTIDAVMSITKILDIILLRISVSPNLMHLQSVDTTYT
jgi:hypothetical protein